MKHILITAIAAVVLVGCGESQQSAPAPEAKSDDPVSEVEQLREQLAKKVKEIQEFKETKAKAEKEDPVAQNDLGLMYHKGAGVPADNEEALKWFHKAAEQGYARAQHNLMMYLHNGWGAPKDNVTAYAWCNIAMANGREAAKRYKPTIAGGMTTEDISKAETLTKEMIKKNPKLLNK